MTKAKAKVSLQECVMESIQNGLKKAEAANLTEPYDVSLLIYTECFQKFTIKPKKGKD